KNCAQTRLTIALLKYELSAFVTQSASTGRKGARDSTLGSSPARNFAGKILADSGSAFRPRRGAGVSVTLGGLAFWALGRGGEICVFMKNAAMPQYSDCFHSVNGWLWHWAHWS